MLHLKKTHLVIICTGLLYACSAQRHSAAEQKDNGELILMVKKDQELRSPANNGPMEPTDKQHRIKVMELLAEGKVKTPADKMNAALILQHTALRLCNGEYTSNSPENYYMAYQLAKSAFNMGLSSASNFIATTYDRYLLYTEGYQKYGTQKVYDEKSNEWVWAPIDPATADEERRLYKVKPLAELLKQAKMKPFPADSLR